MWTKLRYRVVLCFCLGYALLCVVAGVLVAEGTLHPQRRTLDPQGATAAEQLFQRTASTLEDVSIRSHDGLLFKGWLIRPIAPNGGAVLLLHGLSDNRLGMIGYAELF